MARMRLGWTLIAGLAVALLMLSAPAQARAVTDAERGALADTVADFNRATTESDFERIVATIPPKVLETMATQSGMSVEDLRKTTIEQSAKVMDTVKLESFSMDLEHAAYAETKDGTPYATIPTETVISIGDSKVRATGDTLALLDEGKWYLLRVSEPQQAELLKKVYPAFADVQFSPGTMEPVKE